MRATISLATALAILSAAVVEAAPAPAIVTVYQTATQSSAAPTEAAAPAAPASSSGNSGSSGSSLWSKIVDYFDDDSSASSDAAPAQSSGSSSDGGFDGLLSSFLGNSKVKGWLSSFGFDENDNSGSAQALAAPAYQSSQSSAAPLFSPGTATASSSASSDSSDSGSGSGSGSGISSSDVDEDFAQLMLDIHNKYRAAHGSAPLSWSNLAYEYAKNNADNYDCSGVLTHTHGPFGENLAAGFKDGPSAVTAWYDEGQTYNYNSANEYNHFTQVVWKGSTSMGCAMKDCSKNNWGHYVVCEYDPPGNVIGHNKQNVLAN